MDRRGFMQSILAAGVAPWACTAAGVLMPIKKIITAPLTLILPDGVAGDTMSIVQYSDRRMVFAGASAVKLASPDLFAGENGLWVHTGENWIKVHE